MIVNLNTDEVAQISGGNRDQEIGIGLFCLALGAVCYGSSFFLGEKSGEVIMTISYGLALIGMGFVIPGKE